jgi:class 3 adenylate cyclase
MSDMAKILVVDDEADLEVLIRQKFRKKIKSQEYEFVFAINGREALERLDEHEDVDVILSDINMPEMDGLTLLSKLQERTNILKSVVVSAYGDMENIRTAMNRGAFDFITKPVNFQDLEITINKTVDHVKQLKNTLAAVRENNILRMYVDETVINYMSSKTFENSLLENEVIEATVVFIDICSFTKISETEPPNAVVDLLNTYFDVMSAAIIEGGGIVDNFIGDALMAVFKGNDHLDRAIQACLQIRERVADLPNQEGHQFSHYPPVAMGLHSGEMLSGNIGSASLRRFNYTVIGDVVNTAARLQSMAGDDQILLPESVHTQIQDRYQTEKHHDVHISI